MTEYIKKQDVIDKLMDYALRWFAYDPYNKIVARIFQDMELTIKGIPSTEAIEPKRGEWINLHNGKWKCSECEIEVLIYAKGNFCPNCGADMREREGE